MALCALLKSEGRNQKSDPAVAGPKPEEHNSRADFPLANATARALNSIMSEDAAITPPNDSLSDIIASAARRKTYVLTLLLGVALGALSLAMTLGRRRLSSRVLPLIYVVAAVSVVGAIFVAARYNDIASVCACTS